MTNLKVFTAFSGYDSQCMALDRLHGRKEGNQLLSGCGINLGYKCNGGKGFACDRFHWWNQEQRVGMTHYEYMLKQATESDKETMDIQ